MTAIRYYMFPSKVSVGGCDEGDRWRCMYALVFSYLNCLRSQLTNYHYTVHRLTSAANDSTVLHVYLYYFALLAVVSIFRAQFIKI